MESADGLQADAVGGGGLRGRTLVVHTGGIGDLLLAGPAIAHLAADGAVDLAGIPERGRLLQDGGIVERVFSLDGIDFGSVFAEPSDRLRGHVGRYDAVVVWMQDRDGQIARALTPLCPGSVRCFPGLPPQDERIHATAYYCRCVGAPVPADWALGPASPEPGGATCIIHPGSGGKAKEWPLASFQAVAARIAALGCEVRWMLGPAEEHLRPHVADALLPGSLSEAAAALSKARGYVGNDSGMTHLASVLGVPTVAVFGPTDPVRWHPIGARTRTVSGVPWPSEEAVFDAVRAVLSS